jgi:hypothetical protein
VGHRLIGIAKRPRPPKSGARFQRDAAPANLHLTLTEQAGERFRRPWRGDIGNQEISEMIHIAVKAAWDPEARVWYIEHSTLQGLHMKPKPAKRSAPLLSRHSANGILKNAGLPKAF